MPGVDLLDKLFAGDHAGGLLRPPGPGHPGHTGHPVILARQAEHTGPPSLPVINKDLTSVTCVKTTLAPPPGQFPHPPAGIQAVLARGEGAHAGSA